MNNMTSRAKHAESKRGAAFTLIEVIVATIMIGIAIVALVGSSQAFTQSNGFGIDLSNAEFLIEEIREMTTSMLVIDPETGTATFGSESGETSVSLYDDLDDLDGMSFSPPIDIYGNSLTNMSKYTQQITVQNVNANNFAATVSDHSSDFVRITVTILANGNEISSASWIRARL